jgi:hypothetical protein
MTAVFSDIIETRKTSWPVTSFVCLGGKKMGKSKSLFEFLGTAYSGKLTIVIAGVLLYFLSGSIAASGQTPNISLDVRDLHVEFVADKKIRVRGKLRARGLRQDPKIFSNAFTSVAARVDLPNGDKGFSVIPAGYIGRSGPGRCALARHWYSHGGTKYEQETTKVAIYNNTFMLSPAIIDEYLDDARHDGQWISFDKTQDFDRVLAKNRGSFRVVMGLTFHFIGPASACSPDSETTFFQHKYWWIVYGPFEWGTAPLVEKVLTARSGGRRVSFTKKGVKIEKPSAGDDTTAGTKPEGGNPPGKAKTKRKKLTRPSKRPTHLEAVDAAGELQTKLNALPGVTGSTIGLPPTAALLNINYGTGLNPEAITQLAADVSVETAYAAPWVDTVRMSLNGDRGGYSITVKWNAIAAFTSGDLTLKDFVKTWITGGTPLVVPGSL